MGLFGRKTKEVTDPVCGMTIDPKNAFGTDTHDGETFYFCSEKCLRDFQKDPHRYAHGH
ncbi:MAG TPA: YHS domain-containing protein [Candidatus Thermoplasmatota archaeon]|nr:YHS domain-containing protein [Candidatus Thermoplasmatota archaeon]